MREIFNNIIVWLKKHNRDTAVDHLLKGAEANISDTILEKTGLQITDELFQLYLISQGFEIKEGDILDDFHFFPGFYFMPLDESIENYNTFKNDTRWNKNWFPIFANGGGDFYCVDCSDKDKSPVIEFMLDYDAKVVHKSLIDMFKTIDECYVKGVYYEDDGYLELDYKNERIIREKINGYNKASKTRFLLDE